MTRHGRRTVVTSALALAMGIVSAASAGSASAVATTTVGLWNMNEPAGATTAVDSSGNGVNGTVGSDVQTGVVFDGATAYRFPDIAPNSPPTRPQHLVTTPNSALHNPDGGDFTVTVRFRTTRSPGNIVQKGQNGVVGGYWKVEEVNGRARCVFFPGPDRGLSATASKRVDDGVWHTVVCERTPSSVTIYLYGVRYTSVSGPHGPIANSKGLSIGGKSKCDQLKVGCDYFSGDIDYVQIFRG
jgi:hypothetical protein